MLLMLQEKALCFPLHGNASFTAQPLNQLLVPLHIK